MTYLLYVWLAQEECRFYGVRQSSLRYPAGGCHSTRHQQLGRSRHVIGDNPSRSAAVTPRIHVAHSHREHCKTFLNSAIFLTCTSRLFDNVSKEIVGCSMVVMIELSDSWFCNYHHHPPPSVVIGVYPKHQRHHPP